MKNAENERRIRTEKAIVRSLIRHLKKEGFIVFRTFDGEDWRYPRSEGEAMSIVFNLDEVSLRFIPASLGKKPKLKVGSGNIGRWKDAGVQAEHGVLLVLGNDRDVISDWSYTEGDPDGFNAAMDAFDAYKVRA